MTTTRLTERTSSRQVMSDDEVYFIFFPDLPNGVLSTIIEIVENAYEQVYGIDHRWDALAFACYQRLSGSNFKLSTLMRRYLALRDREGVYANKWLRDLERVSCRILSADELKTLAAFALIKSIRANEGE